LAERCLERNLEKVEMRYAPMLAEAQRAKDDDRYQQLLQDLRVDESLVLEPVLHRRTIRLKKKARRWLVAVPRGLGPEQDENEWWRRDVTGRFEYLKPEAELEMRRTVRREWLQFTSVWVPIVFGFLGLLIGLVSVWRK
jgi:hypothetical protein